MNGLTHGPMSREPANPTMNVESGIAVADSKGLRGLYQ